LLRDAALEQSVRSALGAAALHFEENIGQTDARVKFVARGSNFLLALTPEEAALRIHTPYVHEKRPPQLEPEGQGWADALAASALVRVEFAGGNPGTHLTGLDAQPGTIHYFTGNDPGRWRRNVPHYGRVRYEGIYPGVDAIFYGDRRQMEFDFVVAPGADPAAIRMRVEGADSVELTAGGGLLARTPAGIVTLHAPKLYQERHGAKPEVAGRFVWRGPGEIGFEIAPYDHTQALVLDPLVNIARGILASPPPGPPPSSPPPTGDNVALSTLLGGSGDDSIEAIAIGATSGHVYVTGFTDSINAFSNDFPLVGAGAGNGNTGPGGTPLIGCAIPQSPCGDAFVAEFVVSPATSAVTTATLISTVYLGGSNDDVAWGLALDANDDPYIIGQTDSHDFPTTANALQCVVGEYGCEVGGTLGLPVTDSNCGTPTQPRACHHVFFTSLKYDLSQIYFSTYLAGADDDEGYAVAVDGSGNAFLTGAAGEYFPVCQGAVFACEPAVYQSSYNGGGDAFVTEISNPGCPPGDDCVGGQLLYSTYLGGAGTDAGLTIALDTGDFVFLGGVTYSTDPSFIPFPTTSGAVEATSHDTESCGPGGVFACGDGFVAVLSPHLNTLESSTFLGGKGADQVNGIAIGTLALYVTGQTQSPDFLTNLPAPALTPVQMNYHGGYDAFVVAFTNFGRSVKYATFLGGSDDDIGLGMTIDANDDVFLSGSTASGNQDDLSFTFPITANALQAKSVAGLGSPPNSTAFLTVLDPNGNLLLSTYYGGVSDLNGNPPTDVGNAIALDSTGRIYLAGRTTSLTNSNNTASLCLVNQVSGANQDSNNFADNNGFLVIVNPTNSGSACFSPLALGFPPTIQNVTSGAQTLTIFNQGSAALTANAPTITGTNAADFRVSANSCATINGGGASCQISLTFTPTGATMGAVVAETGTLNFTDNGNCPAATPCTVKLSGNALPPATVTLSPSPFTFASPIPVGNSSAPQTFSFSNTSATSPVDISRVSLGGTNAGDFTITSDTCTGMQLPADSDAFCTIQVAFTPQAMSTGLRMATLTVTDDGASNPSVTLNGTGVTAPTLTPAPTLTFATPQPLNTPSASIAATLTNPNSVAVSIASITASGDFSVPPNPCGASVAANSACMINVTFTPTATGARSGTLTVADNFGGPTIMQSIMLAGTGATPPTAILSPSTSVNSPLNFGVEAIGVTTAPMPVTLMNTGGSPLNINAIAPTGDFGETDNCVPSVAAGAMCTIMVTFTPSGIGTRNGSILISDNAAGGQQRIFITGTGSSNVPGFNLSAPLFFGAVLVGSTSPAQTITITNSGGAPLIISGASASGDFGVSANNCSTVPISMSCMISVTFTPTTTGTRTGTLTITDNAPGNPHSVSLSGIGATISIAPPAGGATMLTVTPGDTAQFPLNVTGTQGLVVTLNLSCVSAAPNSRCSVSPQMITLGGPTPPSVTVTVLTNCNPSLVYRPTGPPVLPAPFAALWLGTMVLFALLRRLAPQSRLSHAAPVLLLLLLVVTWAGCINNPPPAIPGAPTTPAGVYNVAVTATTANGTPVNITPPLRITLRVI
jgi:hypothetical protein